jgi:hypothetical protein
MTDHRRRIAAVIAGAALLMSSAMTHAADASRTVTLAKAAVESCTSGGEVSVAAVEARALAAGWPSFADEKVGKQDTRKSQLLIKGQGGRYSDLAILGVSGAEPFDIPAGQKTVTCIIMVPAQSVGLLMQHAAAMHGVPLDGGALFLKREGGKVRPLGLMEMLDEFPAQAAKLKPGEQLILVAPSAKGKLGHLNISVVENPAGTATP